MRLTKVMELGSVGFTSAIFTRSLTLSFRGTLLSV